MNHQEIGIDNLQQITSNPEPILPTPPLWFQLSLGDLIIIPLIMVMLRFTLQSFQLNLTMNQFQIQTPLLLNQFMMMFPWLATMATFRPLLIALYYGTMDYLIPR